MIKELPEKEELLETKEFINFRNYSQNNVSEIYHILDIIRSYGFFENFKHIANKEKVILLFFSSKGEILYEVIPEILENNEEIIELKKIANRIVINKVFKNAKLAKKIINSTIGEKFEYNIFPIVYNDIPSITITLIGFVGKIPLSIKYLLNILVEAIEINLTLEENKKELEIKNKLHRALIDTISDGFLMIDENGNLIDINDTGANILGISKIEAIGKHVSQLVDFQPVILEVLKTGKGYNDKEFIVKNKRGENLHFIKTAVPIKDKNDKIIGVIDMFRKINRVKKLVNDLVGAYARFTFDDIVVAENDPFKDVISLAKLASQTSSNVLILGESGTGKELLAHAIHNESDRKHGPFITINCAAIPRELIESELFGYESGAFTGASKSGKAGKFELADGGTLFLDEIGDMSLDMQAKILRAIEEKRIMRLGGNTVIPIDVRIIAATNKNLVEECEKGNFRYDLFYRLNVFTIQTVPLRERPEAIKKISYYFLSIFNNKLGKKIEEIEEEAMKYFLSYSWPGNVRELENVIERAVNLCNSSRIQVKHLPASIIKIVKEANNNSFFQETNEIRSEKNLLKSLEEIEKEHLKFVLLKTNNNISQASQILGIARNTLYAKLKKYNINI
ncbi:MAG: sigma 54-interacting transcriptional regulator [Caldanaerobacter subterraneus]|nr:sigma 54-interacting transcriptional regulator [Caldanaerobacter subterraneus]